jgi:hypothetical protein
MSRVAGLPTSTRPYALTHAINQIRSNYGDIVDFESKSKTILKFGRNLTVGTSFETVWELGGDEVYSTTNDIDTISSSSGSDTEVMSVEGHTVSGTGADAQFTFVVQTVTLTGQTKATLATPLARVSRAYAVGSTALVGDVYIYEDGAITAGVPNDLATAHIKVLGSAGDNQSYKAATTISNQDYYVVTQFHGGAAKQGSAAVIDALLEIRTVGGLFLPKIELSVSNTSGSFHVDLDPYIIVPKNSDIRVRAEATASSEVDAGFNGYLAQVTNTGV